jgi:ethanolaminephosphotransferase
MTSGSVPSFVDAILNFAEGDESSSMAGQDTWLAQVRAGRDGAGGGRLVMFGDDTWLKLFPGMFVRADGTSSFFVSVSGRVRRLNGTECLSVDRISPRWIEM